MADQWGSGMMSTPAPGYGSPNYSYTNYNAGMPPPISVTNPATGIASMADALINGYFNPNKAAGNQSQAPSLPSYLTLPGLMNGLLGGSSSMPSLARPTTNADPSAGGLY